MASCEVMAVITFSGNVTPQVADAARARLTGLLARDGVESVDTATGVFRSPPRPCLQTTPVTSTARWCHNNLNSVLR